MTKKESHNTQTGTGSASSQNSTSPMPWIAAATLLLGLTALGGFYWNSNMTVEQIRFDGNHFVSDEDLQMVEVPTGVSPDSMNFGEIIRRFEGIPYVKYADISIEPSGNLLVQITERKPIALLSQGENKMYVDEEGIRLPLILRKAVDVPIVYGFSAKPVTDTLKSDAFKRVSDFLTTVQNKPVSNATISEVVWTNNEGIIALTNQNGIKLIFGKGGFETRLRNWEAFYGEVIRQKGSQKMQSVDLRFQGQIVTREQ